MLNQSQSVPVAILFIGIFALSALVGCNETVEPKKDELETVVVVPDPLVMLVVGDADVGERIARQWRALEEVNYLAHCRCIHLSVLCAEPVGFGCRYRYCLQSIHVA